MNFVEFLELLVSPTQHTPTLPSPEKITDKSEKETKQPILLNVESTLSKNQVSESSNVNKRIRIYWPNVSTKHVFLT